MLNGAIRTTHRRNICYRINSALLIEYEIALVGTITKLTLGDYIVKIIARLMRVTMSLL